MGAKYPPEAEAAMRGLFESLPERQRRCYAAVEAAKLGRGGLASVATFLGCDVKTIRRGQRELLQPPALPPGRSRKKRCGSSSTRSFQPANGEGVAGCPQMPQTSRSRG